VIKDVPFLQLFNLLSEINDLELTLLKSHLLVEEALTEAIVAKAEQPKYILEARLTFANKFNLVRSFYGSSCEPSVWKALNLLNKSRNQLAHNLTTDEINEHINVFVGHVKNHEKLWCADLIKAQHKDFFWAVYLVYKEIRELTGTE
jgi:hypothetical protein